ncbi:helix-turn-helix domain-containing protein [Deminuibacter soli]|uniref:DNA-binding protein n=1 Tax=Deminuibacter soli TaxID=2291815 RepID=A0A3E1NP46_9BACT|nr:helix-turn-helix domain-containing protein [Deminuibacter soli]RFM29594.1 DNA-binding protein [Deminuibacter soli]
MAHIIFSEEDFQEILQRLTRMEAMLKMKQANPDDVFVDNQEFLQVMNISKRTAQAWRDQKLIAFSQVGNKIYYKMGDIMLLLQKNRIEPGK